MSIKDYVKEQIALLDTQIKEAEESIKVLKSLGRSTALEEAEIKRARATLKNLSEYAEAE